MTFLKKIFLSNLISKLKKNRKWVNKQQNLQHLLNLDSCREKGLQLAEINLDSRQQDKMTANLPTKVNLLFRVNQVSYKSMASRKERINRKIVLATFVNPIMSLQWKQQTLTFLHNLRMFHHLGISLQQVLTKVVILFSLSRVIVEYLHQVTI